MARHRKPGGRRDGAAASDGSGRRADGRPTGARRPARLPARSSVDESGALGGRHAVEAALANPQRHIRRLLVTAPRAAELAAAMAALPEQRRSALPQADPVERDDLDAMLPPGAVHQGLVALVAPLPEIAIETVAADAAADLVVVLDQVTDPHNVGAVLRSAAGFGAAAMILQDRHSPAANGTLAKAASGALDIVPVARVTNLSRAIGQLQEAGFWCVGLDDAATQPLAACGPWRRTALVLGAEDTGLRRLVGEQCDVLARLPTGPRLGALNVSAAAAIALYEIRRG